VLFEGVLFEEIVANTFVGGQQHPSF
jgi:hypothetical protein